MSSQPVGSTSSPLSISGLASGINMNNIVAALMSAERQPATRMTVEEEKVGAQQQQLQSVQTSLRALALAASEFSLPSLFETGQTATSSEPNRVSATVTSGAGVGGHQVEVKRLANSGQRTFTFVSPAAEDTVTIEGREYKVAAGSTAKALAEQINSDSEGGAYAAVLERGEIVLSTRATGATGPEFLKVTDPGGTLKEVAGTAREGTSAEYAVDGVEATSKSNTVTTAIAGVTLNLLGVTTTSGPVTVDVQPPQVSTSTIESQIKAFISTYNSTVEALEKQLTTKPPTSPTSSQYGVGALFGDNELSTLLNSMRQSMYEPIAGLSAEMSSPAAIGLGTGAAAGKGGSSQGAIEGLLGLEGQKLSKALQSEPAAVETMLQKWSLNLQKTVEAVAQPGGTLEARITGDGTEVTELRGRVAAMNEVLLSREKALQLEYAELEGVLANNASRMSWLASQAEGLTKAGI